LNYCLQKLEMKKIKKLTIHKKVGETPLQVLNKLKKEVSFLENQKLTYVGRLDPMAEGRLLVLIGDECKNKKKYLKLDKEYYFEILLGFKTDTADVLGLIKKINLSFLEIDKDSFFKKITKIAGNHKMKYPLFSSKTVNGMPLFAYAKKGKTSMIVIPEKEIKIYRLKYLSQKTLTKEKLQKELFNKINLIKEEGSNDFRKDKILKNWKDELSKISKQKNFFILKFSTIVSSGTYVRNISEKISENLLDNCGLAWSIKRTKIGIYKKIFNSGFWLKKF